MPLAEDCARQRSMLETKCIIMASMLKSNVNNALIHYIGSEAS
jgi:hypothetical protein